MTEAWGTIPTPNNSMQMALGIEEIAPATGIGPLGVWLFVSFTKIARGKCSNCGIRRILFVVRLGEAFTSPGKCGKCCGIR